MTIVAHYNQLRSELEFFHASYVGGSKYANPPRSPLSQARIYEQVINPDTGTANSVFKRSFNSYLIPHPAEGEREFEARVNFAAYVNIVRPIVDAYAQAVTSNVQRKLGSHLGGLLTDLDYRGTPYSELVEQAATNAAIHGMCFAVVDSDGRAPKVILVNPTQVAWIVCDDYGRIEEFAYVNQAQYATEVGPALQHLKVRVWNKTGWSDLEGTVDISAGNISDQTDKLGQSKSGPLPAQLQGQLPVVPVFYERDNSILFPQGVSLVSDTARIARQIYNKLSWASDIHRKVGFPVLTIPVEKTGGALPPDTAREIGPAKAIPFNSSGGSPAWIAPSAESTQELRNHCVWLFQVAFKLVGLELAADQSTQTVSGINLRVRAREFESRAKRFANHMERFERQLIDLMAKVAGVSDADVSITYPQRFTLPDMSENIANAIAILDAGEKYSLDLGVEAKLQLIKQLVSSGLALSEEQLNVIMAGIRTQLENGEQDTAGERELVALYRAKKAQELAPTAPPEAPAPGAGEEG